MNRAVLVGALLALAACGPELVTAEQCAATPVVGLSVQSARWVSDTEIRVDLEDRTCGRLDYAVCWDGVVGDAASHVGLEVVRDAQADLSCAESDVVDGPHSLKVDVSEVLNAVTAPVAVRVNGEAVE